MRRIALLVAVLLCASLGYVWATGSLTMPVTFGSLTAGQQNLSLFDQNFAAATSYINAREITQNTCANRPTASTAGRWYFCTDTNVLYADTGAAWTQVAGAAVYVDQMGGLTLSNPSSASGTTMNIGAGAATSDDSTIASRVLMTIASFSKTNGAWAVGTGNGCLDAGTVAASSTYHFFVIQRTDTGVVDVLCSLSAQSPQMPTNYTKKRRIGADFTDTSTAWTYFTQFSKNHFWLATISALNVSDVDPGTASHLATASVPNGVRVQALLNICQGGGSASSALLISSPDLTDTAPSLTATPLGSLAIAASSGATPDCNQALVWVNSSRQFRYRASAGGALNGVTITTVGWFDPLIAGQ